MRQPVLSLLPADATPIRDNPRVPWALRDLCNPWTWAYSLDPSRLQYLKLSHYS